MSYLLQEISFCERWCHFAIQGDSPLYFTVFAASGIPIHVVNHDECDEFYRANVGTPVLGVRVHCMTLFNLVKVKVSGV